MSKYPNTNEFMRKSTLYAMYSRFAKVNSCSITVPVSQRRKAVNYYISQFCTAVENDVFPPLDVERVFGVVQPDDSESEALLQQVNGNKLPVDVLVDRMPIGGIVYSAWRDIYTCRKCVNPSATGLDRAAMSKALMDGNMPEYFLENVLEASKIESTVDFQLLTLKKFENIPYDAQMLAVLGGQPFMMNDDTAARLAVLEVLDLRDYLTGDVIVSEEQFNERMRLVRDNPSPTLIAQSESACNRMFEKMLDLHLEDSMDKSREKAKSAAKTQSAVSIAASSPSSSPTPPTSAHAARNKKKRLAKKARQAAAGQQPVDADGSDSEHETPIAPLPPQARSREPHDDDPYVAEERRMAKNWTGG